MGFVDLPPQVRIECDGCGAEHEMDGITLYLDAAKAVDEIRQYDWTVVDGRPEGKVLCFDCTPDEPKPTTYETYTDERRGMGY